MMKRMMFAAILAAASLTRPALAATLDQVNNSIVNVTYSFASREGSPVFESGQSFSAGLTGTFAAFDLPVWRGWVFENGVATRPFETDGVLTIYNAAGIALGSKMFGNIPTRDAGGFFPSGADLFSVSVDVSSLGIPVIAGENYIFTVRSTALLAQGLGGDGLSLLGNFGDTYAGGSALFRFGGTGPFFGQSGDVNFRTYIDVGVGGVPEPASWAMLIAGFGLIGGVARRQRAVAA